MKPAITTALFLMLASLAGSATANIAHVAASSLHQESGGLVAHLSFHPVSALDGLRVEDAMPVARLEVVHPGESRAAVLAYHGCKTNIQGECRVSVSFHVVQPNGKTYDTPIMDASPGANTELIQPATPTNLTPRYLSPAHLLMEFEESDALGSYTLEARLVDHHAVQSVTARQFLWLVERP